VTSEIGATINHDVSILIATVGAVGLLRGAQPASNSSMM
jgi:hypothetical protein